MRGFIMLPAVVIILLTTYFTMKSATKPRRNIVFGVTLPSEAIYDIRIQESIIEYSKKINLYILICTIIVIPMFFMPNSIETVYLLVWVFFVTGWVQYHPYKIMNKRIKAIKQEEPWYVGDKKIDTQPIYVDNDQYWIDGYKYYNENDTSVSVNSRYGTGITYNLATKKGKFFNYGIITILGIILVPVCISLVAMDFSRPKITISETLGKVSVKYPIYNFEFDTEDIEHIKVVDEIKFKLRTNGIGTSTYSRGDFSSNEYGKCRVYIYNDSKPYIVAKLKNRYFIYNEKNQEDTMKVYEDLKNTMN